MTDVMDADPGIEQEAQDVPKGLPVDDLYIATYLKLEPIFTGWTREPRAAIAMRQKAADVALNIVALSTRGV